MLTTKIEGRKQRVLLPSSFRKTFEIEAENDILFGGAHSDDRHKSRTREQSEVS